MKGIVSNPNIAPYIKESVIAYQENNALEKFYTTFFEHPDYFFTSFLIKALPSLEKEFKRRSVAEIQFENIKGRPIRELIRTLAARKLNPLVTDKIWEYNELNFDQWVANHLKSGLDFVHAYEHAALATLTRAKNLGIPTFYEQPSQHHKFFTKIVKDQVARYKDFSTSAIQLLADQKAERRNARRDRELEMADFVICNSSFTARTLIEAGISQGKMVKVPYGFPDVEPDTVLPDTSGKVIFMNAGNHNLRKGIHLLYEAWKRCNFKEEEAELWMVGKNEIPDSFLQSLPATVRFFKNMPRTDLMKLYSKTNVFVLPTLADGFGMVISEAMSKGVPVLTTTNSAGPDIIRDFESGLIIPPDSIEAIEEKLKWCVVNKHLLKDMGAKALEAARQYPWSSFRKELIKEVRSKLSYEG